MKFTDKQIDEFLEFLLPAEAKNIYERSLAKLSMELGTHQPNEKGWVDGDALNRLLWGLAVGARRYNGPIMDRVQRTGPFTYAERLMVKWAFPLNGELPAESKLTPTIEYLGRILNRPASEVRAARTAQGPGRGIAGFGL